MKQKRYLGLYDSGVGGLTVLEEIKKIFPNLSYHYLADNSGLPLGNKSSKEIQMRVKKGVEFLFAKDCFLVILACNTASITSARYLQQKWLPKIKNKNMLGISWPLIEHMEEEFEHLKNSNGLILATQATHESPFYQDEFTRRGFKVKSLAVPNLSVGIEKKSKGLIKKALEQMKEDLNKEISEIDYVVLACTHFPLALFQLKKYFRPQTEFINPARAIALKLKKYLKKHPEFDIETNSKKTFFWTT